MVSERVTAEQRAREVLAALIAEDDAVWRDWLMLNPHRMPRVTAGECIAAMLAFAAETREEAARAAEGRAGYRKRGETIAQAIRRGEG